MQFMQAVANVCTGIFFKKKLMISLSAIKIRCQVKTVQKEVLKTQRTNYFDKKSWAYRVQKKILRSTL